LPQSVRRALFAWGAVITAQLVLGITTLLLAVPVPLGVLHQFTGVLALTAALIATQRATATASEALAGGQTVQLQTGDGRNYSAQTGVVR